MQFETPRLTIRKLTLKDLMSFYNLHSDSDVMDPIPAPILSYEESKSELNRIIEAYEIPDHRLRIYGAFLLQNNEFIGLCAAIRMDQRSKNIGYRLLKKHWGQGFGTELTKGLIDFLKTELAINTIHATVSQNNIASKKILEKFMHFIKDELDVQTNTYESHFQLTI